MFLTMKLFGIIVPMYRATIKPLAKNYLLLILFDSINIRFNVVIYYVSDKNIRRLFGTLHCPKAF